MNLKRLLSGQPMLDLISKQIEEGDAYYKRIISESNGEFKESRIDLKVQGISAAEYKERFFAWQKESWANPDHAQDFFLSTMAPAHPEHYALPPGGLGIVEVIGGHMCCTRIQPGGDIPDLVWSYGDPAFEIKLPAKGYLMDGTLFFYILMEMRDVEDGGEFRLRLLFPSASPQQTIDEHAEHLAVEWRSFITTAFMEGKSSPSGTQHGLG